VEIITNTVEIEKEFVSEGIFATCIPILVWGSPNRFGDPHTKMGIPKPTWGAY
jgi:hypothetical protein